MKIEMEMLEKGSEVYAHCLDNNSDAEMVAMMTAEYVAKAMQGKLTGLDRLFFTHASLGYFKKDKESSNYLWHETEETRHSHVCRVITAIRSVGSLDELPCELAIVAVGNKLTRFSVDGGINPPEKFNLKNVQAFLAWLSKFNADNG